MEKNQQYNLVDLSINSMDFKLYKTVRYGQSDIEHTSRDLIRDKKCCTVDQNMGMIQRFKAKRLSKERDV